MLAHCLSGLMLWFQYPRKVQGKVEGPRSVLLQLEAFIFQNVLLSKAFVSIACPVLNLIPASVIVCA